MTDDRTDQTRYQEGDRLPNGMKIEEAVELCRLWWDNLGRRLVRADFNQNEAAPKVRAARGGGPAFIIKGDKSPLLKDGILDGLLWCLLSDAEKAKVLAAFFAFQLDPNRPQEPPKLPEMVLVPHKPH